MNKEDLNKSINEDLKIDHSLIKAEWEKLPLIYYKWSKLFIEAQYESNEARAKLSYIEAVLSNDIRINHDKYELKNSPTETAIKNIIIQNKDYIEARRNHSNLLFSKELLNSVLKSLEYKKSALENLNQNISNLK